MVSSVSSECAFLQGGITIGKCHSYLKGDIVEALQCVKCAIHCDFLFCETGPSSIEEEQHDASDDFWESDDLGDLLRDGHIDAETVEEDSWDSMLLEEEESDLESDIEMD
jgi:hypothetical protein